MSKQSFTFTLRQVCQKIDQQMLQFFTNPNFRKEFFNESIDIQNSQQSLKNHETPRSQLCEKVCQSIRNMVIRNISNNLMHLTQYEQNIRQQMQDMKEQSLIWQTKYKKIYRQYQNSQLQVDKLKIQIVTISDSFQKTIVELEQLKISYKQLWEQRKSSKKSQKQDLASPSDLELKNSKKSIHKNLEFYQQQKKYFSSPIVQTPMKNQLSDYGMSVNLLQEKISMKKNQICQTQLKNIQPEPKEDLSRELYQNEPLQHSKADTSKEIWKCQKQLYQIQIRQAQKEIENLNNKLEQSNKYIHLLQKKHDELQKMLNGEKDRSQSIDKQMFQLINQNQNIKLAQLEDKAIVIKLKEQNQLLKQKLEQNQEHLKQAQKRQNYLKKRHQQHEQKLKNLNQQFKDQKNQWFTKQVELNDQIRQKYSIIDNKNIEIAQLNEAKNKLEIEVGILHQQQKNKLSKIHSIQKMSQQIKQKYEQKVCLLQKNHTEQHEKYKNMKVELENTYKIIDKNEQKKKKDEEKCKEMQIKIKKISTQNNGMKHQLERLRKTVQIDCQMMAVMKKQIKKHEEALQKYSKLKQVLKSQYQSLKQAKKQYQLIKLFVQQSLNQLKIILNFKLSQLLNIFKLIKDQKQLQLQKKDIQNNQQVQHWKKYCQNYEDKYAKLQKQFSQMTKSVESIYKNCQAQSKSREKAVIELEQQKVVREDYINKLKSEIKCLKNRNEQIQSIEIKYQQAKKEVKQLKRNIQMLESSNGYNQLWKTYTNLSIVPNSKLERQKSTGKIRKIDMPLHEHQINLSGKNINREIEQDKIQKQKNRLYLLKKQYQLATNHNI